MLPADHPAARRYAAALRAPTLGLGVGKFGLVADGGYGLHRLDWANIRRPYPVTTNSEAGFFGAFLMNPDFCKSGKIFDQLFTSCGVIARSFTGIF